MDKILEPVPQYRTLFRFQLSYDFPVSVYKSLHLFSTLRGKGGAKLVFDQPAILEFDSNVNQGIEKFSLFGKHLFLG